MFGSWPTSNHISRPSRQKTSMSSRYRLILSIRPKKQLKSCSSHFQLPTGLKCPGMRKRLVHFGKSGGRLSTPRISSWTRIKSSGRLLQHRTHWTHRRRRRLKSHPVLQKTKGAVKLSMASIQSGGVTSTCSSNNPRGLSQQKGRVNGRLLYGEIARKRNCVRYVWDGG